MTDPMVVGETILSLLDEASLSATYKPALLLAIIDECQAAAGDGGACMIGVRALAERVSELYWPQTRPYGFTGTVLRQNSGQQAAVVRLLEGFRRDSGAGDARTLSGLRKGPGWERVVDGIERSLAEMPIPRLQIPYDPFLYTFDWPWQGQGGWRVGTYRGSSRAIKLLPGIADSLVALGPLLRPFILRRWTDKAAALNRTAVPDARAVVEFERFLFGADRATLTRLTSDLLDLQLGDCFYCGCRIAAADVDHFVPWSYGADDGIDNLVAACARCNAAKRATLAGPAHLEALLKRNKSWTADLDDIVSTKLWVRDAKRTHHISRAAYLVGPPGRRLWSMDPLTGVSKVAVIREHRPALEALLR